MSYAPFISASGADYEDTSECELFDGLLRVARAALVHDARARGGLSGINCSEGRSRPGGPLLASQLRIGGNASVPI